MTERDVDPFPEHPTISVVIACHDADRLDMLEDAIDGVLRQGYGPKELVVVADGAPDVAATAADEYPSARVLMLGPDSGGGCLEARNAGARAAEGDVVAFLDDDAVPRPGWLDELARLYREHDALAAGGRLVPRWPDDAPVWWLPPEYYWLVGATHRGFAGDAREAVVRNTFGSNLSFRRDVFLALDGFDTARGFGRQGDRQLQAGETELAQRLRERYDRGVRYSAAAVVEHHVDTGQLRLRWLLNRAYNQGVSKRVYAERHPEGTDEERGYLRRLATRAPARRLAHLVAIPVLTAAVGLGYLAETARRLRDRGLDASTSSTTGADERDREVPADP